MNADREAGDSINCKDGIALQEQEGDKVIMSISGELRQEGEY
jgi:hypothetical protein